MVAPVCLEQSGLHQRPILQIHTRLALIRKHCHLGFRFGTPNKADHGKITSAALNRPVHLLNSAVMNAEYHSQRVVMTGKLIERPAKTGYIEPLLRMEHEGLVKVMAVRPHLPEEELLDRGQLDNALLCFLAGLLPYPRYMRA
ncbi:hypothetical protein PATA110616_16280 [Paenibacillus tarimensis]